MRGLSAASGSIHRVTDKIVLHSDEVFLEHDTGPGHPEQPERARVIARALAEHEAVGRIEKADALASRADLELVHDAGYLGALEETIRRERARGGGAPPRS